MGHFVATDRKTAGGRAAGFLGTDFAGAFLNIGRSAETAIGFDGEHRHRAAKVVRHEKEFARRVHADKGGTQAARAYRIEQCQLAGDRIDGEGTDGAGFATVHHCRGIGRINTRLGGIESETGGAGILRMQTGGRKHSGAAIHAEEMNASAIARRQQDLITSHKWLGKAVGAHVRHERGFGGSGLRF